jgi:nucleoside-diphosphate-sugar epimerase
MGDSRRPETTQFDMVQAFVFLAGLRLLPLRGDDRLDIVPVNFVAESIVTLHQKEKPQQDIYHLSAGAGAQTCKEIAAALSAARQRPVPRFLPRLESPFSKTVRWLSGRRGTAIGHLASLLQVFLPYLTWNTVFANERVTSETGQMPAKFTDYCYPLYKFAKEHNYTYPYRPWPIEPSPPPKEGC